MKLGAVKDLVSRAGYFILWPIHKLFDGPCIPWRMKRSELEAAYAKRYELYVAIGKRRIEQSKLPNWGYEEDVESAVEEYRDGEWRTLCVWRRTPEGELVMESL